MENKSVEIIVKVLPTEIECIFFDFDGVFTNNEVIVHEDGSESVTCNRSDGMGISFLRELGIPMLIISTEENAVVSKRAEKLKLPARQGVKDKALELTSFAKQNDINLKNSIYMGNDVNDIECMNLVGLSVAPLDAHQDVKSTVDVILSTCGGKGAVRELVDYIIESRKPSK